MKTLVFRCCTMVALAVAAGAVGLFVGAQETGKDKPERTLEVNEVARVGERVISAEELIQCLVEREKVYEDPDMRSVMAALEALVLEEMLALECDRLEASPKRPELEAEFATLNGQFEDRRKADNKQLETPYTREEYIKAKTGLSVKEFEAKLRQAAKDVVVRRLLVNYWMMTTESADAEGLKMKDKEALAAIRKRLLNGEVLGPIATANSEDMHTRESGGVIGTAYRGDGTFEPGLDEAFWDLEAGEWSGLIATDDGYWLVRKVTTYVANEAEFFDLREECFNRPNPTAIQLARWYHAMEVSGRFAFERRVPGWDVQAGEK